jgi:hypothetical protein
MVWTQFQSVTDNSFEQFRDLKHEAMVWAPDYRTAPLIYPFTKALKRD